MNTNSLYIIGVLSSKEFWFLFIGGSSPYSIWLSHVFNLYATTGTEDFVSVHPGSHMKIFFL